MSRYVIWTNDDNLEVFVGFDEGMEGFFLTIADTRICTGEAGSYLFHNMDHHPGTRMTIEEVALALARFGLTLPLALAQQLASDSNDRYAKFTECSGESPVQSAGGSTTQTVRWQSAV